MIRFIHLIAGLWVVFGLASAQTQPSLLSGRITDESGAPLPGATLQAMNPSDHVATSSDLEGNFALELAFDGEIVVKCSFVGYIAQEQTVSVSPDRPTILDFVLQPLTTGLDAVVVSAGRFEQSAAEVTVSLDVLPPRIVESRGTISLETALEQNPGVSFVDGEPQIRSGSGFSYGAGSRVMILVDDLPVLSGDAGRPTWGFLPLENLEQIEIIKGASSVLYGSAALSGVINIRTRYPDARPLTRVTLQHGVFSTPRNPEAKTWQGSNMQSNVRFLHSQQLGKWDMVVGGNILANEGALAPVDSGNSIGYRPWEINHFNSEKRARINVNLRRRVSKVDGLQYGLNANWQASDFLNTLIWENAPNGIFGSYDGAATRTKQVAGTLDPHIQYVHGNWRHQVKGRWFHLVNDNDNDQGNASDVLYGEYQAHFRPLDNLNSSAGLVMSSTSSTAELYSGGDAGGENKASNLAAFVQLDWEATELLHFSAGGRYEQFSINEETEGRPVFRAGMNLQLAEATHLRASWGQGFRFPTIAERFIRTGLGALQIYPNPNLIAESAWAGEVGFKQGYMWGGLKGFLDAAIFHQRYENYVEFTFGPWGGLGAPLGGLGFTSLNTGKTMNTGFEISTTGQLEHRDNRFDFILGYTYTNPIALEPQLDYNPIEDSPWETSYLTTSYDTTGHVLKYRSQHMVRMDVQWTKQKWSAGLSLRYQSALSNFDAAFVQFEQEGFVEWGLENWLNDHPKLPWIADFRVAYEPAEHHKVSLLVNNLANSEYSIRPLAIEDPRLVQLMYTFEIQ